HCEASLAVLDPGDACRGLRGQMHHAAERERTSEDSVHEHGINGVELGVSRSAGDHVTPTDDLFLPGVARVVGGDVVDSSVLHRSPQGRNLRGPTVTVIGHDAVSIEVVGRCERCEAFGRDPYATCASLFDEGKDRSTDMHEVDVCSRVLGEKEYTGGRLDLVESALLDDLLLDLCNSPADPVASPQLLDLRIRQMHGDRKTLALGLSQDVQQVPVIRSGQLTVVLM